MRIICDRGIYAILESSADRRGMHCYLAGESTCSGRTCKKTRGDPFKRTALRICPVFYENHVTYNTMPKPYQVKNGAMICEGVEIGEGTIVFPGAYVDSDVKLGTNCYVASGVRIVGEVLMMGSSSTGERAYLSGNVVVRDGVSVGNDAFVGMGSVVTKNVPAGVTVKGNPAK